MSVTQSRRSVRTLGTTALAAVTSLGLCLTPMVSATPPSGGAPAGVVAESSDDQDDAQTATGPLVAADALGRQLVDASEAPAPRADRTVGMFYFLWHGSNDMREYKNTFNLSEALAEDPEAWRDPQNGAFPPPNHFAHWAEPLYGYYRSDDEWVVRRHLQMLSDAQVDYLVLDTTNQEIYKPQVQVLMEQIVQLQAEGVEAPQLVFMTRSDSRAHMDQIYETFYAPDAPVRYPSTWFAWDGKPLIMGVDPSPAVREFFTFRTTQWPNEEQVEDGWDWMSFDRPQRGNYDGEGNLEQMAVSVAQNSGESTAFSNTAWYGVDDPPSRSRAFHDGIEPEDAESAERAILEGANLAEEWEHAIEQDPATIMLTGWNEWIAGNWATSEEGPMLFYDVLDERWNRDSEPVVGRTQDNYYLQLVDNIRRYKGVGPADNVSQPQSIDLHQGFQQWQHVGPIYRDYEGDTISRDHPGVDAITYVNDTGRNNITEARVARDTETISFYADTEDRLTRPDETWMHLYLDVDEDLTSGWAGYDARVVFDGRGQATLQLHDGDRWRNEQRVESRIGDDQLAVSVPRQALGLAADPMRVAFKWWDNPGEDIMSAYTSGDAAPEGRFSYLYDTAEHESGPTPAMPDVEPIPEPEPGRHRIEDTDFTSDYESAAGEAAWEQRQDGASSDGSFSQLKNPEGEHDPFWRTFVRAGFRGDSVSWIAPRGPQGTEAEVFVDGLSQGTVDLNAPDWRPQETVFTVNGLPEGFHELMVVYAEEPGTYYHDAFEIGVRDSGASPRVPPLDAGRTAWVTSSGFTPARFEPTNPAQATDGSLQTWWTGTGSTGEYLDLSLGSRTMIRTVHIAPRESAGAMITRFHIEAQSPGGRWRTIGTGTDLDRPTNFDVRPMLTDRVRLVIDETTGGLPEIAEFALDDPARR